MNLLLIPATNPSLPQVNVLGLCFSKALLSLYVCIHSPGLCCPTTSFAALLWVSALELNTALWLGSKRPFCSSSGSGTRQREECSFCLVWGPYCYQSVNVALGWKNSPSDVVPGCAQHRLVSVSSKCQRSGRKTAPWITQIKHHTGHLAPVHWVILFPSAQVNIFSRYCQRSLFGAILQSASHLVSQRWRIISYFSLWNTKPRNHLNTTTSRNWKMLSHPGNDQTVRVHRSLLGEPTTTLPCRLWWRSCVEGLKAKTQVSVMQVVAEPCLHFTVLLLQNQIYP